jgi:Spy/CpxP family protein refolding chaperone
VLRALDLTAAQQAQIQDIQSKHQATLKTIFSGLRSANEGVTDNLLASREVTAKQKKSITDLQAQLLEEQLAVGAAVRDVLTPDQLTKAAEIMAKQKALRAQWKSTWENDQ